jgi:tRNA nucleotidyltransferase (CCA-adding enzyme)
MSAARWQHFSHEADIGVRGIGATPAQAFEQAGLALTAVITDPVLVRGDEPVAIECEAPDRELLFVDWLNALIYEMATRNMLFGRFKVSIADSCLAATAWGEAVDRRRHQPAVEVKGASMTELRVVRRESGEWIAECVVDV